MATIVIIEDDPGVCDLIETILSRVGHRVIVAGGASDGAAIIAREFAGGNQHILAITDIFMPDRDGLELTAELKREYPQLPIIAISGGGSEGDMGYLTEALTFGASLALPKPFRPIELRAAVDELLRSVD